MLYEIRSLSTKTTPTFGATASAWATQFIDANIHDHDLVDWVLDGLQNGFDTGINENADPITVSKNHNVDIISQIAIAEDILKGYKK